MVFVANATIMIGKTCRQVLVVYAGSSVTKKHSDKAKIKAAKRWNGGSISSFANAELRFVTK